MKIKAIIFSKKKLTSAILFFMAVLLPNFVPAQSPPPPGPGGGNPDDPLAVPFETSHMILLLAVSVFFAVFTYKKMLQKQALNNTKTTA